MGCHGEDCQCHETLTAVREAVVSADTRNRERNAKVDAWIAEYADFDRMLWAGKDDAGENIWVPGFRWDFGDICTWHSFIHLEELLDLIAPGWRDQLLLTISLRQMRRGQTVRFERKPDGSWGPRNDGVQ